MAKKHTSDKLTCLTISRMEAVEIITLLTAQLAGVCAPGQTSGACPEIRICDRGQISERIVFAVEQPKENP